MKKRLMTLLLAGTMSAGACLGLVGCGDKKGMGNDDEKTLQIYIGNFGYGYDWLETLTQEFPKQQWVIDKYGEINVPTPAHNSEKTYSQTMILGGGKVNQYDLMFSTQGFNTSVFNVDSNGQPYFEELTSLLETEVPGEEGVTLKAKMKKDILESEYLVTKDDIGNDDATKHLYGMPWVDGMMGLLWNESFAKEALGSRYKGQPLTTNELVKFCAELIKDKPAKDRISPFIFASNVNYFANVQRLWWAQYEGYENYHNYYKGVDADGALSNGIFSQSGRLYSLEALEDCLNPDNGYIHKECNSLSFTQAQSKFLAREGFMMPNGDWIENEMRAVSSDNKYSSDVIKFMNMPIISALSERLSYYTDSMKWNELDASKQAAYDEKLSAIVKAIDEGKTFEEAGIAGITAEDYAIVLEARSMTGRLGGHVAYIPAYAKAKELAKDFLRYLATDSAIAAFMKATNGCATVYEFDNGKLDFELPSMHAAKLQMQKTGYRLYPASSFPLVYFGGLTDFSRTNSIEVAMCASNAKDRKTAQQLFDAEVKYYTESNGSNWQSILTKAGM